MVAAAITWASSGLPPTSCSTLGCLDFSRVPLPAARMAIGYAGNAGCRALFSAFDPIYRESSCRAGVGYRGYVASMWARASRLCWLKVYLELSGLTCAAELRSAGQVRALRGYQRWQRWLLFTGWRRGFRRGPGWPVPSGRRRCDRLGGGPPSPGRPGSRPAPG